MDRDITSDRREAEAVVQGGRETERERDGVLGVISDNGVGIAGDHTEPRGLGLRGIRDRLKGLQGELELQSSSGAGTQLIISIPVAFVEHSDGN